MFGIHMTRFGYAKKKIIRSILRAANALLPPKISLLEWGFV